MDVLSLGVRYAMYADDLFLYAGGRVISAARDMLSGAIGMVIPCLRSLGFEIFIAKCQFSVFTSSWSGPLWNGAPLFFHRLPAGPFVSWTERSTWPSGPFWAACGPLLSPFFCRRLGSPPSGSGDIFSATALSSGISRGGVTHSSRNSSCFRRDLLWSLVLDRLGRLWSMPYGVWTDYWVRRLGR